MGANYGPASLRDVDRDDGRHDGALRGTDDSCLSHREPAPTGHGPTVGARGHFRFWIPRGLDGVFRSSHLRTVGIAPGGNSFHHDGGNQSLTEWRAAHRCWHFPVDTAQARVPEGLPVASILPHERVARGFGGGFFYWV